MLPMKTKQAFITTLKIIATSTKILVTNLTHEALIDHLGSDKWNKNMTNIFNSQKGAFLLLPHPKKMV